MSTKILTGDCREVLKTIPDRSIDCCISSPPYWGLRDYGHPDQIGQEETPEAYVESLVKVFMEVHRCLKDDGTLWLNLGDCYAAGGNGGHRKSETFHGHNDREGDMTGQPKKAPPGLKPKDLVGVPWMVAFALRSRGWWLRESIIWDKSNCMPESVTDRCTRSHEDLFHLAKSEIYYHDGEAIKEPCIYDVNGTGTAARKARASSDLKSHPTAERGGIRPGALKDALKDARKFDGKNQDKQRGHSRRHDGFNDRWDKMDREEQCTGMRNKRDVWRVAPAQYREAHFATFPPKLITPCVLAGCRLGGTILDPFGGSGTTGEVAEREGRHSILIELNPEYVELAGRRTAQKGLFT